MDNGDQATKSFVITMDGEEITGTIDKGVWTADDAANQPVVDAVKAAGVTLTAEETKGLEALADSLGINAIRFWEKDMK